MKKKENKKEKEKDQKTTKKVKSDKKKKPKKIKMLQVNLNLNKILNKGLIFIIIGLLFLPMLIAIITGRKNQEITLSQLVRDVRADEVQRLEVAGSEVRVYYDDADRKFTRLEEGQDLVDVFSKSDLDLAQTDIEVIDLTMSHFIREIFVYVVLLVVMVVIFSLVMKQAKGGQGGLFGFGQSKAKLFVKGKQDVKFDDVGGMREAKQELEEVVDFLKSPKKYLKVGARTPKGVLLVGPSGTGKTLLARAVAGEANVQFLSIAGSEFMEMLVGVGASRARDLFATAKKLAPSIIFIDEIDAIGRMRGRGVGGGHDEREQTLNQILVEMDGFTQNDNVIVMAATNRGDMLDPALIRPGRFDRRVRITLPDLKERKHIVKIHAKGKPLADDVNIEMIAKATIGFSGADIENTLNEAAIAVARDSRDKIIMDDIDEASLKVKYGPSKKRLQNEIERKMTAYHEIGHAILAHLLPHADRVHKISIVSRGQALGYTFTPPERDKLQVTKSELINEMVVMMGGRAAEQLIFDEQTAGASSDIQRATKVARAMVVEYGMSKLGPMYFGPQYESKDYSKTWGEPYKISDELQKKVDDEIASILKKVRVKAELILKKNKKKLDKVSIRLMKIETMDGDEFEELMGVKKAKAE